MNSVISQAKGQEDVMNAIGDFLTKVDDLVWGVPLIVLILAAASTLLFV